MLILPRHVVEELAAPPIPQPPTINLNETPFQPFTWTTTKVSNVAAFLKLLVKEDAELVRVERRATGEWPLTWPRWHVDYKALNEIELECEEWT